MSQSLHCLCDRNEKGGKKEVLATSGTLADKRNTLTHTHATETKMGAVSGVRQRNTWQPCFQEHPEGSRAEHSRYYQLHQSSPTTLLVWNTSQQTAYKRWVFPILTAHYTKNKSLVQPFWAEPKPVGICLNKSLGICINIV